MTLYLRMAGASELDSAAWQSERIQRRLHLAPGASAAVGSSFVLVTLLFAFMLMPWLYLLD